MLRPQSATRLTKPSTTVLSDDQAQEPPRHATQNVTHIVHAFTVRLSSRHVLTRPSVRSHSLNSSRPGVREAFTTGTPAKRLQTFGKEDTVPRTVYAVLVVTPASKVNTAYLVRHAEVAGFQIKYVATKSNKRTAVR